MRQVTVPMADLKAMLQASLPKRQSRTLMYALTTVASGERFIDILARYVEWNQDFKTLVLVLAGEIQLRRDLFGRDGAEAVAHAVFEAAVDEYRDRHGTRANAMLHSVAQLFGISEERVAVFRSHPSVRTAREALFRCYAYRSDGSARALIGGLWAHAASELLAATEEFAPLDVFFKTSFPDEQAELSRTAVDIEGKSYPLYGWIEEHRGLEIAHFEWACKALNAALHKYRGLEDSTVIQAWGQQGFERFVEMQAQFMEALATPVL